MSDVKPQSVVEADYNHLLVTAIKLAVDGHGYSINKDGSPYILHPFRLMMQATTLPQKIVAVLHDTIEDTPITLSSLRHAGFPAEILLAVDAVTKREGEEYEAFVERIALNPLAAQVKLLDLYDNIDVTKLPSIGEWELKRTAKYHRAILRLKANQQSATSDNSTETTGNQQQISDSQE